MYYPNLRAEMARKKVKGYELAAALGIRQATLSAKLNGKSDWTLEESRAAKLFIGTAMPLELLFKREEG